MMSAYAIRRLHGVNGNRTWGVFLKTAPNRFDLLVSVHRIRREASDAARNYRRIDRFNDYRPLA